MATMLIQWLDDDKFGSTQEAEIVSNSVSKPDPITGEEMLMNQEMIVSGGISYPMSDNGRRFIITTAPLDNLQLIEIKSEIKNTLPKEEKDPLGYNITTDSKGAQTKKVPAADKFVVDLYTRAKKKQNDIISANLMFTIPTMDAMASFNSSFDSKTVEDLIDYIIQCFDEEELRTQLRNSLYTHYKITQ